MSETMPPAQAAFWRSPLMPWNDRAGRFDGLRALAFAAVLAPALWLAWRATAGTLGPRAFNEAIRFCGTWTVRFLLAAMSVTPLRILTGYNRLIGIRRMLGVAAFLYIALHFVLYCLDQKLDAARIASEIWLRLYLTIGFVGLVGYALLAATSFDGVIRRMGGKTWGRLHKLVHVVMALSVVHFLMQAKLDITEAAIMLGFFLMGELLRLAVKVWPRPSMPQVAGLAMMAGLLTMALEALWYGLATRVSGWAVLAMNLDFDPGLIRPVWIVLPVSLALVPLVWLRKTPPPRPRGR